MRPRYDRGSPDGQRCRWRQAVPKSVMTLGRLRKAMSREGCLRHPCRAGRVQLARVVAKRAVEGLAWKSRHRSPDSFWTAAASLAKLPGWDVRRLGMSATRFNRRSFLSRIVGAGAAAAGSAMLAFEPQRAWAVTDRDYNDAVGHGGGGGRASSTDQDPYDRVGHGQGNGNGRGFSTSGAHTGVTDQDSTDQIAHGTHTPSGTDQDPTDRAGEGHTRGLPPPVRQSCGGTTDADSSDRAGCGRNSAPSANRFPDAPRATSGLTDHDPSDTAGNGRGSVH
jgi:hypothetical protein